MTDCSLDDLTPYVPGAEKPWNKQRILHLFRRTSFGIPFSQVDPLLSQDPGDVVDAILAQAQSAPPLEIPDWSEWTVSNYSNFVVELGAQVRWQMKMFSSLMIEGGLRHKMTNLWMGLLVTKLDVYECPSYLFKYHQNLHENGLGDFKALVHASGLQPGMLVFLKRSSEYLHRAK